MKNPGTFKHFSLFRSGFTAISKPGFNFATEEIILSGIVLRKSLHAFFSFVFKEKSAQFLNMKRLKQPERNDSAVSRSSRMVRNSIEGQKIENRAKAKRNGKRERADCNFQMS